jgi:hypothetical protein
MTKTDAGHANVCSNDKSKFIIQRAGNVQSKIIRSYTHSSVALIIVSDKNVDTTASSFHPNYLFVEPIFEMAMSLRWRTCLEIVDSRCSASEMFLSDNTK